MVCVSIYINLFNVSVEGTNISEFISQFHIMSLQYFYILCVININCWPIASFPFFSTITYSVENCRFSSDNWFVWFDSLEG
jgi:hypothetical protein